MSIKVTLEFDTATDAAAFLQSFDAGHEVYTAGVADAPKAKRGRPAAAQPAAASTAPAAAAATAAQAPAVSAVAFKDVADKITALSEADYDKAVAVLAKHGVKSARDLKPEQFAGVVDDCVKALAPAPTSAPTSLI